MKTTYDLAERCDRCGGLMVLEWIGDLEVEESECWRCVICGERIDPVIIAHRHGMAASGQD